MSGWGEIATKLAERTEGAGLGLSIVAAIAEAHGAEIDAQTNPGGGLEVTVRFAEHNQHDPGRLGDQSRGRYRDHTGPSAVEPVRGQ